MENAAYARGRIIEKIAFTLLVIVALILVSFFFAFIISFILGIINTLKLDKGYNLSCHPRIYVQELSIPALLDSGDRLNSSVIIGLKFSRGAALPSAIAMYSDLNMNLYYGEEPVSFPVGNGTVPHFRMGDMRSVNYTMEVEAPRLPWEDAISRVSGGSTVHLRLELFGKFKGMDPSDAVRYGCKRCNCVWYDLQVEADVRVDASAHMLSNIPILFTV